MRSRDRWGSRMRPQAPRRGLATPWARWAARWAEWMAWDRWGQWAVKWARWARWARWTTASTRWARVAPELRSRPQAGVRTLASQRRSAIGAPMRMRPPLATGTTRWLPLVARRAVKWARWARWA